VIAAYAALAFVYLIQAVFADVAGMRAKHVPGMPVVSGHDDPLFRAMRAQANTNENLPWFLLVTLAAMFAGVSASAAGACTWTFVTARVVHMLAYYLDIRIVRSAGFAIGLLAMIVLLALTVAALL
jgi:uncharacterized MAPEG superfamily protein